MTTLINRSASLLKYAVGAGFFWLAYVVLYSALSEGSASAIKYFGQSGIPARDNLSEYMTGYVLAILLSAAFVGLVIVRIFRKKPLFFASLILAVTLIWKLYTFFHLLWKIGMPPSQDLETFWYYLLEQHVLFNLLEFVLIPSAPLLMTYLWLRLNRWRMARQEVNIVKESGSAA